MGPRPGRLRKTRRKKPRRPEWSRIEMFSFSFGEILIIVAVGLIVIGPDRLPETAVFLGILVARIQRQFNEVRTDIHREMQLREMKSVHREFSDAARGADAAFRSAARGVSEEAGKIQADVVDGGKSETKNGPAETMSVKAGDKSSQTVS